ncbi:voltage-gated potassium channel [Sedimentitalea nanhaiensis]|uniref:Voltage-gated potassium channel n=2 Tax=Sedimentitalea nanhaiensis TaxID=999627 RepID=A0A1I6X972_9RHOB|nr:voltage-gated potassium channel [Sedimentitalea nanhaiensis]
MMAGLKQALTRLYRGASRRAELFRYGLIAFDAATILYFIVTTPMRQTPEMEIAGTVIGLLILMDFAARLWIAPNRKAMLRQIYTIADVIVVASLLLAPFLHEDVAFLRILRGLRLIHSYHLLRDLRRVSPFFRRYEDAVIAAVNLLVFVLLTTTAVYTLFFDTYPNVQPGLEGYVDALYFTVSTLTTTGYGDITPVTMGGKLFSVFVMVVGVALFVRLAQAVIQPSKIRHKCPTCGLLKHDPDAVHCKHCGEPLKIETEGVT